MIPIIPIIMFKLMIITATVLFFTEFTAAKRDIDDLNMGQYIKHFGYSYENHTVLTEDGFYLTLGRIPAGKNQNCTNEKGVVVALHGLMSNGDSFLFNGPNRSLGFLLADDCYDVWLYNTRGTRYSIKHMHYSNKDRRYWNSTLDDITYYDVPVLLNYIWNITGRRKIHAVGVSVGSALLVQLLSRFPSYQDLIASIHLVCPVVDLSHFVEDGTSLESLPFQLLYAASKELPDLFSTSYPHWNFDEFSFIVEEICKIPNNIFCGRLVETSRKPNPERADTVWHTLSKKNMEKLPLKAVLQIGQTIFDLPRMYDYGSKNFIKYGSDRPPLYPIENIKTLTYIYHSRGDMFANPDDVISLANRFPNLRLRHFIDDINFGHFDFVISPINIKKVLNDFIVQAINNLTLT